VQDLNKHFQYLWRFNAVAMAVIGLGIIVAFVVGLVTSLWGGRQLDSAGAFGPVPNAAKGGYTYRLENNAIHLAGTSEAMFVLRRWKGEPREGGSRASSGQDVNLLVVNGSNAESHWLFHGTDRRILSRDELHASDTSSYNDASPVVALVLAVAEADAGEEHESLYYYRVGGGTAVRFFTADHILARQQFGTDRYLVIYEDRHSAGTNLFSLIDFKLLATKKLPEILE